MPLTLKILSFKGQPSTQSTSVTIGDEGGTIGRSPNNTLVLPDPEQFVSRHHASISVKNNLYYLTDSSLGGIFIDEKNQALHNNTQQIFNGTRLKIGEYEIVVSIADEAIAADFSFHYDATAPESSSLLDDKYLLVSDEFDADSLLINNNAGADFVRHEDLIQADEDDFQPAFESGLQGNRSVMFDNYTPPNFSATASTVEEIPEGFSFEDLLADVSPVRTSPPQVPADDMFSAALEAAVIGSTAHEFQPPVQPPVADTDIQAQQQTEPLSSGMFDESGLGMDSDTAPEILSVAAETIETIPAAVAVIPALEVPSSSQKTPISTTLGSDAVFAAFLQGAGINSLQPPQPEQLTQTMLRVGQMFRKLVDGTATLLRSRAEFKSLFRVNMTVIRTANNNPLKFIVSTDDVVRQLLENKSSGFLDSTAAIEEGFADIVNHQLAMQAGIQASLMDLLRNFDPKRIEMQCEQGLMLQKKSKCWDKFSETYQNRVDDAVNDFFGDAFVKAYEAQMKALTAGRNKK